MSGQPARKRVRESVHFNLWKKVLESLDHTETDGQILDGQTVLISENISSESGVKTGHGIVELKGGKRFEITFSYNEEWKEFEREPACKQLEPQAAG